MAVAGVAAPALGQERPKPAPTETPAIGPEDFPPLRPIAPVAQTTQASTASGGIEADGRVLLAATYWLLLGGVALRRARRQAYSIAS
jgi:hypothetical protein